MNDDQKTIFPTRGKNYLVQFNKFEAKLAYPFVIALDLESVLRNPEQSYEILNAHKNVSYAFKVCVADNDIYANIPEEIRELVDKLYLYRATDDDENLALKFLNEVHMVCDKLVHYIKNTNIPMKISADDNRKFEEATNCYCCYNDFKVKLFAYSGLFLGAVCRECDLQLRVKEKDLLYKEVRCPETLTDEDLDWLDSCKQQVVPSELSNEEYEVFNQTNKCSSCEQSLKVKDHDHLTGLYRGPACNSCNLKLKYKPHIPILAHNLRDMTVTSSYPS